MEIKSADLGIKALMRIDENIDQLVRNIELLSYVNPVNIEEAKERFFKSKYLTDPEFRYPRMDFDKFRSRTTTNNSKHNWDDKNDPLGNSGHFSHELPAP